MKVVKDDRLLCYRLKSNMNGEKDVHLMQSVPGQEKASILCKEVEKWPESIQTSQKQSNLKSDEDAEELYADLFIETSNGTNVPRAYLTELEDRIGILTKAAEIMKDDNQKLQKQVETLQDEKEILIRNISCLYKTAKLEIERKNKQIDQLRQENAEMKDLSVQPATQRDQGRPAKRFEGKDGDAARTMSDNGWQLNGFFQSSNPRRPMGSNLKAGTSTFEGDRPMEFEVPQDEENRQNRASNFSTRKEERNAVNQSSGISKQERDDSFKREGKIDTSKTRPSKCEKRKADCFEYRAHNQNECSYSRYRERSRHSYLESEGRTPATKRYMSDGKGRRLR